MHHQIPAGKQVFMIKPCLCKIMRLSADVPLTDGFRRLRQTPSMPVAVIDRARRTVGLLHLQDIARYITQDA